MAELLTLGFSGDPARTCPMTSVPVPETSAPGLASRLVEEGIASEAVVLSAGHLTELYLVADDVFTAEALALAELATWTGLDPASLADSAYALEDDSAVDHLLRIAAGVGCPAPGIPPAREPIETAHRIARDAGSAGPVLDRLFCDAMELAAGLPAGNEGADCPGAPDELEVRRCERRVACGVERFAAWRSETLDGDIADRPTGGGESDAQVVRLPRPGDAA